MLSLGSRELRKEARKLKSRRAELAADEFGHCSESPCSSASGSESRN